MTGNWSAFVVWKKDNGFRYILGWGLGAVGVESNVLVKGIWG